MRKINYLVSTTLILLLLMLLGFSFNLNATEVGPREGLQAPDFTLENLEGKEISLEDFRGQTVFLNFWASWCPPCREEMPHLQKFHEEEHEDIEIIAINLGENKSQIESFVEENELSFTILQDPSRDVGSTYHIRAVPTSFVIDEEGIITSQKVGLVTYEELKELLLEE